MDWEMSSINVLDWRLADVPELGYFNTDRPFPRGELLLKTRSMIKGYYKHPKVRRPGGPELQGWQGYRDAARTGLRASCTRPAAAGWLSRLSGLAPARSRVLQRPRPRVHGHARARAPQR
jgi:hypothetical protein